MFLKAAKYCVDQNEQSLNVIQPALHCVHKSTLKVIGWRH